jgi:putative acetyltransferase
MITIKNVTSDNPHLHRLIAALDRDLLERYPPEEIFGLDFNDPEVQQVLFVVAYVDDEPVGCGAIRPMDSEETELKRFYVDPGYRNRGIAGLILADLERRASVLGFSTMKLEAGTEQPEALHFYQKHGYKQIPCYGEYIHCHSSICMEKGLKA